MTDEATPNRGRVARLLQAGMPRLQPDYLIERATWSATITYILFTGIVALFALPVEQRIGNIASDSAGGALAIYTVLFCLLFGVLTLTMGQAERRWQSRLSLGGQLGHLTVRVGFALALALPSWVAYMMAHVRSWTALTLVLVHLGLWGLMLGLAGWRLELAPWSDIVQFNVKYGGFFAYLVLTGVGQQLPIVGIIGPFRTLDGLMTQGVDAWGALLQGAIIWIALGLALMISVRRAYERS
ncbi:MAG: hypothetical protein ABEK03_00440 [Candidatus Bipolaricaulia bacterium]